MGFLAANFQPLASRADRQLPVAAHLQLLVQRAHRVMVERVARPALLLSPEQGLVSIREPDPPEVGHGIGLNPDDIVEDPVAEILKDRADPVDVVIGADDPQGPGGLQDAPAGVQPSAGEGVVLRETAKLVPAVVHRVDPGLIGPPEFVAQLQVVGGVREHQVHPGFGQAWKEFEAIPHQYLVHWRFHRPPSALESLAPRFGAQELKFPSPPR